MKFCPTHMRFTSKCYIYGQGNVKNLIFIKPVLAWIVLSLRNHAPNKYDIILKVNSLLKKNPRFSHDILCSPSKLNLKKSTFHKYCRMLNLLSSASFVYIKCNDNNNKLLQRLHPQEPELRGATKQNHLA